MNKIFLLIILLLFQIGFSQVTYENNAATLGVGDTYGISYLGGGVSFMDFDGDGWDDITFSTAGNRETLFYRNVGGNFVKVDLGINDVYETKQVLWVDFDNDGDKDFFATSISGLNKLYKNTGNMTFTDISENCGLFNENLYTFGASFGDIDNDGDLDVFIANRDVITKNQRNYLYLNNNGIFLDITAAAGLFLGNELSFCASFFDYNKDGYQDIYVSSDKYTKINRLYRNKGDLSFEDVSLTSGAGISIDAMSTTIGDYNKDGWFDIYVTNTSQGNYHLRNNQDGTFTNVAAQLGTAFYSIAWGAVFLDSDNDEDLDLYVSGMLNGSDSRLPSAFYENRDGYYVIPPNAGFDNDNRISFSNAVGDFNHDGLPDIIVMNDSNDNFLWENTTSTANNWVKVRLQGSQSNRDGIGSTIEVVTNGEAQYRYTLCGEGYLGQNSGYELFGLKDATAIDYIKVTWLSGTVDLIENVSVNQAVHIIEGSGTAETIQLDVQIEEPGDQETEDPEPLVTEGNTEDFTEFRCTEDSMVIYPNPSVNGVYNVCTEFNNQSFTAEVFDMQGRKVATRDISYKESIFSLINLRDGVYIVRIKGNGRIFTKKIIKQ